MQENWLLNQKVGWKKIYEELLAFVFCDEMRIIQERT